MKNPKWRCAYPNSHKVKFGGKFLTQWEGYHLTLQQSTGGTISADKLRGYPEQSANLSYTANNDYYFNGWQSTGANIQNNKVPFTQDTTAKATFSYTNPTRSIHTKSNTNVSNASGLGSYKATVGSVYNLGVDYIISGTTANHGWSANYLDDIEAIHFKFKSVPITLNGSNYLFDITTMGKSWEWTWNNSDAVRKWVPSYSNNQADTPCIISNNNRDGINGKKLATLSSNRFPVFSFSRAKSSYVNTNYAVNINGTIYAKCDDWTKTENDVKYLMRVSAGNQSNSAYDRTCLVSAYYNNKFVGSAWQGLYNTNYKEFYAYFGLFSATNTTYSSWATNNSYNVYQLYEPVAGSSQFDMANFNNINNAKHWLDSL